MIWIILPAVVALVLSYVLFGRAWLKTKFWAQGFFARIEPVEIWLWNKSETILWSRFLMLIGILPPLLDQFQLFNTPALLAVVPEKWQSWLTLTFTLCGIVSEINRRYTTKPLTIVQVAEKDMTPTVVEAMAVAEDAKNEAVAVVAEEKAERNE